MIGKPEWFTYKLFGWGIRPKTWQGWLYILAWIILVIITGILPLNEISKGTIITVLIVIIMIDSLHVLSKLNKYHDERQRSHQATGDRNACYAAIASILIIAIYQTLGFNIVFQDVPFDSSIIIVLIVMALAKGITTIILNKTK
jgi:hypothetical protein